MVLKAIGKYIDTLPINDLLSQEEVLADSVVFEVGRFYNGYDLAEFTFFMRGVTESRGETQTELTMEVQEEVLRLCWKIDGSFTAEAGRLSLDLYGCLYAADAEPSVEAPEAVIRYQLPPVQVRALPESEGVLDSQSYTEFLLEVRAAANDAIEMIEQATAEFEEKIPEYDAALSHIIQTIVQQDSMIKELKSKAAELDARVADLETRMAGVKPVVSITQSAFEALEEPDPDTLYVVTG